MTRKGLLACIASALLGACSEAPDTTEPIAPRVKYFVVGEETSGQLLRVSGRLVAADSSPLSFQVSGTVDEVLAVQGDRIGQGGLLARLDPEPLRIAAERARAQVTVARASVVETQQIYERTQMLFERQAVSQADLDTATANHAAARGTLRAAESDLEQRERDLTRSELRAPFAGTIATREVEPFQEVSAGQEAFVLQVEDALEVEIRVPETQIRSVDYGQDVEVRLPSLADEMLIGTITEIGSRAESGNAFPVRVQLPATDLDLRAGMTAGVTFNFRYEEVEQPVYLIPISALAISHATLERARGAEYGDEGSAPVFVVNENNVLEVRDVIIGGLRGNQFEVFEGLEPGDRVVSAGVAFLREGMRVELWSADEGLLGG